MTVRGIGERAMNRFQLSRDLNPFRLWGFLSAHLDILTGALAGLLAGFLLLALGPTLTVGIFLAIVFVFILFKTPELAILFLLLLTSGLLPAQLNPSFNLFVGHFQLSDLILISLLAVTALRLLAERKFRLRPTPLYLPLVLFCLAVVGGMLTAVIQHGIPFSHTTYEARILLHYTVFFAVLNLIRTPGQVRHLVYGIIAIGILVGTLIILQVVLGFSVPILMPTYFKSGELMRAYHPGYVSVMMTIMAALCLVALPNARRTTLAWWVVLILLGLSVLISLGRNVVISLLFVLGVLILLLHNSQRTRFLSNLLALVLLAVLVFGVIQLVAPSATVLAYPKALFERFVHLTTTDPLSPEETILWRVNETRYAVEHLLRQPLLGIGLEVEYRPPFFEGDKLQGYIHNGYLWLWLKTGLAGLVSFLWFFAAYLARGFRHWKNVRDEEFLRPVTLGFTLIILAMLISNFIAPLLVSTFSLVFFGAGMGIVEAAQAMEQEPPSDRSAE